MSAPGVAIDGSTTQFTSHRINIPTYLGFATLIIGLGVTEPGEPVGMLCFTVT